MTTIGYGDKYPKTTPGRILTFILSIWGVIIVSLMVVALSTFVDPTNRQKKAFHMMKQLNFADERYWKAGDLIKSLMKTNKVFKKANGNQNNSELKAQVKEFKHAFLSYRNASKQKHMNMQEMDFNNVIILQNDILKIELQRVKHNQNDILKGANKLLKKILRLKEIENKNKKKGGAPIRNKNLLRPNVKNANNPTQKRKGSAAGKKRAPSGDEDNQGKLFELDDWSGLDVEEYKRKEKHRKERRKQRQSEAKDFLGKKKEGKEGKGRSGEKDGRSEKKKKKKKKDKRKRDEGGAGDHQSRAGVDKKADKTGKTSRKSNNGKNAPSQKIRKMKV